MPRTSTLSIYENGALFSCQNIPSDSHIWNLCVCVQEMIICLEKVVSALMRHFNHDIIFFFRTDENSVQCMFGRSCKMPWQGPLWIVSHHVCSLRCQKQSQMTFNPTPQGLCPTIITSVEISQPFLAVNNWASDIAWFDCIQQYYSNNMAIQRQFLRKVVMYLV